MEANKIGCRMCGGTSFTKTDKTAKCDYCGSEFDLTELQARTAKIKAEQKTLDSLADDISRLRQLADQKEAERQKAIEEEKCRQDEAEKQRQEYLRKQEEAKIVKEAANKAGLKAFGCGLLLFILTFSSVADYLFHAKLPHIVCGILLVLYLVMLWLLPTIVYYASKTNTEKNNNKSNNAEGK